MTLILLSGHRAELKGRTLKYQSLEQMEDFITHKTDVFSLALVIPVCEILLERIINGDVFNDLRHPNKCQIAWETLKREFKILNTLN